MKNNFSCGYESCYNSHTEENHTCLVQNTDISRVGRGGAQWGGRAGRGWAGHDADESLRPGDINLFYPPRHQTHVS